jgi:hypothetical protein
MQISVHPSLCTYLLLDITHLRPSWNKGVMCVTYLWQVLCLNPAWMEEWNRSQSRPSTSFLIYNFQSLLLNTVFFITVSAVHVSGGFCTHHQELKTVHTTSTTSVGELFQLTHASGSSKQASHIPDAVSTVLSSRWRVEKPPETCRALTIIKNTA